MKNNLALYKLYVFHKFGTGLLAAVVFVAC